MTSRTLCLSASLAIPASASEMATGLHLNRYGTNEGGALPGYRPDDLNAPRGPLNLCEACSLHRAGGRVNKNADSNRVIGPRNRS